MMKVAVIGAGAAGFFAAISVKQHHPNAHVTLFEKTSKILSKVKISGGGRCNVTNGCSSIPELCKAYPRGGKRLKSIFSTFGTNDTRTWFESRGVPLIEEADGRVFPVSNQSQTIIDCLVNEAKKLQVDISLQRPITRIKPHDDGLILQIDSDETYFHKVVVCTGGSPKIEGLRWLKDLGHRIESPAPSLFTFNLPQDPITQLMGVVAPNTVVSLQGTKLKSTGPLLITHWGMSGPAILKLSAFGARELHVQNYQFAFQVNWVGESNQEKVYNSLQNMVQKHPQKGIGKLKPFDLPERLWHFLLSQVQLEHTKPACELGKKRLRKLTEILTNDVYHARGKTNFKEEFVTCGGVSLNDVDLKSMQSRMVPNLYFAGEVLDIDAITGGYNFQAAWSTGFIAGKLG